MKRTARAPKRDPVTTAPATKPVRKYGRGSGVPHPIDVQVGKRIRARRRFCRMNQQTLALALGLTTFQQIQKYEQGTNRVSASKLSAIADTLGVPVSYFFIEGAPDRDARMEQSETIELIRCYYAFPSDRLRQQFLQMVKAVAGSSKRRGPERDTPPMEISAAAAGD